MSEPTMVMPRLTSPDRHMLQAYHLWLTENNLVPQISVMTDHPDVDVPDSAPRLDAVTIYDPWYGGMAQVARQSIVLTISYQATKGLTFGEDALTFSARFQGVPHECVIPYAAIMMVQGRGDPRTLHLFPRRAFVKLEENQVGMYTDDILFGLNTEDPNPAPAPEIKEPVKSRSRAHLSVVK